jgi:hypothetical protein
MRRVSLGVLTALLTLSLLLMPGAVAQEATPEPATGLAELGLPTLDITVTADAFEGIPDSLEAGRYLVTISTTEDVGEFGGGVGFIQPVGVSVDEFLGLLAGQPEAGDDSATPAPVAAEDGAPSAVEEEMGGLPPFVLDAIFAGGTYAFAPGASAQVVLDLPPGEWIAWGDDPGAPWPPVTFTVTGEMPAELPEPESSATLIMTEYDIQVAEGELRAGQQVIRVDNVGAQPHFIAATRTTEPVTEADLEALLESELTGTPAAVDFDPDTAFEDDGFYSATQSRGTSQWVQVDLQAGTHVLVCFFPDVADGLPHAYHGMYTIVEVSE